MNAIEVVKAGLAAAELGKFDRLAAMLTDDMVFTGPVPEPIGKREFVALQVAVVAAMPDWKFNEKNIQQTGDKVSLTFQITGTQTAELQLPMPGFPKVPPTGKHVALPEEHMTFTVRGDKLSRIESDNTPGGGVPGILAQLGVPLPPM